MDAAYQKRIEDLYLQMYEMLFEYARSNLISDALAEEAVQDTFVIACQKPDACLASPNPKGWLVNTLKFVVRNTLRSQNTALRILASCYAQATPETAATEDRPNIELLYGDLADREEFRLMQELAEGRSYAQMAADRGISLVACRKRVQRAREFLQQKMKVDVT